MVQTALMGLSCTWDVQATREDDGGHGDLGVSRLALLLVAVVARDLGGAHCVRGDARHALLVVVVARCLGDAHGVCGDARRALLVVVALQQVDELVAMV